MKSATMLIALAAAMATVPAVAHATAPACPTLGSDFGRSGEVLKVLRAFTGADGESHIEPVDMKGKTARFFDGKVSLTSFDLGDPTAVVLVHGQSDVEIPAHRSPYREIFLILSGYAYTTLKDGSRVQLDPGTLLMVEDQASRSGRGGASGPCGYVALDLQFKSPPKP